MLMLSDHTWLVADNEVHEHLFGFARDFGEASLFEMPAERRPRDIEALARVGEGEFLVVGSHSHRRDGSHSRKRHRLRWLRFVSHQGGAEETDYADASEMLWQEGVDECRQSLFTDSVPESDGELAESFCQALVAAGEMDIEGAASVDGHVWLGFRRPQIDGDAVMARLAGRQLRFDAIETIDLGGRAIRAMDSHAEQLYVIGGPSEDAMDAHALFVIRHGDATELAPLPPYSEGLALHSPGHALIVTDGRAGAVTCDEPSRVKTIHFSVPAP
ncbi:MAG: DUF3616 domain-containing protein [Polyangiales bacterium]